MVKISLLYENSVTFVVLKDYEFYQNSFSFKQEYR